MISNFVLEIELFSCQVNQVAPAVVRSRKMVDH